MSAIDVYSPFGTYAEGNVVSTGAESQQDCGVNSVYAAGSRSLSEPPFSSLDQWNMDWNKFEFTMTRLSRETETTLAPTIQFSAGHLNGHNSLTDAPAIVDSGPAIMSTIEHLSLPAAAYQVPTGKYLGHYPIHDY
ncbi:hypothetical protein B0H17DRAFT_1191970 [Mycena rosella]|uniref:Uncharacterized protein n=1 Tax=Mycena rosella TaxID=1033263 RepID=A0AAD7GXI7_MYCRO|nr:hypothetical protein B0H17DRAFT_1191970 [Mycena rosella]